MKNSIVKKIPGRRKQVHQAPWGLSIDNMPALPVREASISLLVSFI